MPASNRLVAFLVCISLTSCGAIRRHPFITVLVPTAAGIYVGTQIPRVDPKTPGSGIMVAGMGGAVVGVFLMLGAMIAGGYVPPEFRTPDPVPEGDPAGDRAAEDMLRRTGGPIGANLPGYDPNANQPYDDVDTNQGQPRPNAGQRQNQGQQGQQPNRPGTQPPPPRPDPCPALQAAHDRCVAGKASCSQACNQRLNACRDSCLAQQSSCKEPGAFTNKCVGVYARCSNTCDASYGTCSNSCGNCSSQHSAWLNQCGRVRPAM